MSVENEENDEITALPVAERFYSVQGEGISAGVPAVFLRTGGCNLLCGAPDNPDAPQEEIEKSDDAEWLCDSIETFRNPEMEEMDDILADWEDRGLLEKLRSGDAHLILTGGEPLLHQKRLGRFLERLGARWVEVETNGTIPPGPPFDQYIDQFNVSLKLSNSGMDEERRLRPNVIQEHVEDVRSRFKFVVASEEDINEVDMICEGYDIPAQDVMLMPAGADQETLHERYAPVMNACMERGYRFSPRLHITGWNTATGV